MKKFHLTILTDPILDIDRYKLLEKVRKYNYRNDRGFFYKNIGFKVKANQMESVFVETLSENTNWTINDLVTRI